MSGQVQKLGYWGAYLLGRTPWDTGISPPELVEVVEGGARLTPGRALDVGCGTGTNCAYLASHGWEVVGVDFTARALAKARRRVAKQGLAVSFLRGDATRLGALGLQPGFDMLLDIGCFHSVAAAGRGGYVAGVAALARPGSTYLLFCFRGRTGVSDQAVRAAFAADFELLEVRPGSGRFDPAWYRMRRR
ncbi:MAG: class I SAM-dependent methyltransferase [Candidatus Dormibacteria bacterium]